MLRFGLEQLAGLYGFRLRHGTLVILHGAIRRTATAPLKQHRQRADPRAMTARSGQ